MSNSIIEISVKVFYFPALIAMVWGSHCEGLKRAHITNINVIDVSNSRALNINDIDVTNNRLSILSMLSMLSKKTRSQKHAISLKYFGRVKYRLKKDTRF